MAGLFLILAIVFFVMWRKAAKQSANSQKAVQELNQELESSRQENSGLQEEVLRVRGENAEKQLRIDELSRYEVLVDVDAEIQKKRMESAEEIQAQKDSAAQELLAAKQEAKELRAKGKASYEASVKEADLKLSSIEAESKRIISEAQRRAEEIAGDAYKIAGKAEDYKKAAAAMKNVIEGYGDQYLKPTYNEAGQQLKLARENSARMIKAGTAATCDYVEDSRRNTAIAFVIDAFNGKVDSILSKIKKDNYGTLEQKIKDSYELVNHNGRAFRNATITPEYLSARLEELKWGVRVQELRAQAQEEQRRLREQIREEERARREYEKAMKEAAKEEEMLRKAMEKAAKQIESATEANRAEYEAKLEDLKKQLAEAEERGKRALSMAQQTKHGNVYVISNIGSFGENVYKVGMTRRLDPMDRVRELGDASVPFPFDVHAIIESDDAPALEATLHKLLALMQVNKVNPRKEFFRVMLSDIKAMVDKLGLKTVWTIDAAAAEYRETLAIEAAMKSDPESKNRWEKYNASIAEEEHVSQNETA